MKQLVLSTLRAVHVPFQMRELPERVAIYFHDLEPTQFGKFSEAVGHFLDHGYRTVTAGEYTDPGASGKLLFVSFDDNFQSWHRALRPLDRLGATATFYVNTGVMRDEASASDIAAYFGRIRYQGASPTLSRQELKEIHDAGHAIGCHTHTHRRLPQIDRGEWANEIDRSKAYLEDFFGDEVVDFSYPYGMRRHFSESLKAYCSNIGFRTIATAISGLQLRSFRDPLTLHRTGWKFENSLERNLEDLRINGSLYAALTGRSLTG
ncbi:peptidoglycan/xylan/chitin deacetylase (PgdA/CDA1 family) [Rhodobium orientis]|uniref:polysaccharide deacetylase family protein n=1 Tax=Rhodobium orientis TaxID=34017 RepID=UPI001610A139|nr:peptidoglycan/xylan/chitin deacetylase (PgdA/CDA1 family) [Rhodobium orientis]